MDSFLLLYEYIYIYILLASSGLLDFFPFSAKSTAFLTMVMLHVKFE